MQLPDWTPETMKPLLHKMESRPMSRAGRLIFEKLLSNRRMLDVYHELLRRDRKTGHFFHAVKNGDGTSATQLDAIYQILQVVIAAASDRRAVSTPKQIEQTKIGWLKHAEHLDLLADNLEQLREDGAFGLNNTESSWLLTGDIKSLSRIVNWIRMLTARIAPFE